MWSSSAPGSAGSPRPRRLLSGARAWSSSRRRSGPVWSSRGAPRVQGREAAELPLAMESLEIWRSVAEHGDEFELRFGGNLYLCTSDDEVAHAAELCETARANGLTDVRLLTP